MNHSALVARTFAAAAALLFAVAAAAGGGSGGGGGGGGGGSSGTGGGDTEMPGEVLVKLRSADALPALLTRYGLTLVDRFGQRPIYRLKVIGSARPKDVVASLALEPDVLIAETNVTHSTPEARKNIAWAIGTPQAYAQQWAPQALHLADAQQLTRGAGVRIAVLDTGVDPAHPLLAGRLLPGRDLVDDDNDPSERGTTANAGYGHGTHVAGLLATVAPAAQLIPVRVLDPDGVGNAWVLAEAMLWAIDPDGNPLTDDGAHVINLSLGSMTRTRIMDTIAQIAACIPQTPDDPIGDRTDPGYADDAARCSSGQAALVVAAAGNDASGSVKEYPAAESAYGLMAVAATNASGKLASFSNTGSWIEFAAPGDAVTSAFPGGGYATWSGTSMAAPLAAGVAALVRSQEPALAPKDVIQRLRRTSQPLCSTTQKAVDARAAVTNTAAVSPTCK